VAHIERLLSSSPYSCFAGYAVLFWCLETAVRSGTHEKNREAETHWRYRERIKMSRNREIRKREVQRSRRMRETEVDMGVRKKGRQRPNMI
jgi:hypothetical protein